MAVQPALKMWSRQSSSANAENAFRTLKVTVTEAYQILHDVDDSEFDKYLAPGLPRVGQVYPETNFVLAGNAQLSQVSPIMTIATVQYQGEIAPGTPNGNPLLTPPQIRWSNASTSEEIDEDIHGNPIQTKAGERIRGIQAEFPDQVLTVTRNFAEWDSYTQAAFSRAVNSTIFAGWPAGTGKVKALGADSVSGDAYVGQGYWRGTLQVQFRIPYRTTPDKAWWARSFHQGHYCVKRLDGPPTSQGVFPYAVVPCVDGHKTVATSPKPLDVDGIQIPDDSTSRFSWLEFERYPAMNLNLLGFL